MSFNDISLTKPHLNKRVYNALVNELQVIPSTAFFKSELGSTISQFTRVVSSVPANEDERQWTIVKRRFGLENPQKLTLEELGLAF